MKTEEEFKEYYNKVLVENTRLLEDVRTKTHKDVASFNVFWALVLLCSAFIVGFLIYNYNKLASENNYFYSYKTFGLIFAFIAVVNIVLFVYIQRIKSGYRLSFRNYMIKPILDFYNKGLSYIPEKIMPYKTIAASNLFNNTGDYVTHDYIEGKIGKRFVQMALLDLSRNVDSAEDAFKGLMLITPLQAAPAKEVVLVYSWPPQKSNMISKPIKYGPDEFQKEFTVFASNESLVPGLLSYAIIEWMLALKRQSNAKFCISFTHNSMFLAIQSNSSIFEPAIKKPVNPEDVFDWAHSFHIAVQAIADFDAAKKAASSSI